MYTWAANKQKLNRSIAFVNSSLGEQVKTPEEREQMTKEYYMSIAGLVNDEPLRKERKKNEK